LLNKIPINNLFAKIERHRERINAAFDRVITSGHLILGSEVNRFERIFATYLGAKYCVSLANGTDAIELALKAMNIKPGDRVGTVANAGMYTTSALLAIGAEPHFMDVNYETKLVSLKDVTLAIELGVKAIVVTHLYGLVIPEIELISKYCLEKNIALLEDCAQAHGAKIGSRFVGTFGNASSFSFYPTKNLGAMGDGGAVITNDLTIAENVRKLRQYGWKEKYQVTTFGARNSRLDELQAAVLSEFLPHLEKDNIRRREIAQLYSNLIDQPDIQTPNICGENYVAHLYVVCSKNRDLLRDYLNTQSIGTEVHYPIPDHKQPIFNNKYKWVKLPNTDRLCSEILTLPCYPELKNVEVLHIIDAISSWKIND
jgi:dTDP-4-amino-4,6-dideoxygalactose transaminase